MQIIMQKKIKLNRHFLYLRPAHLKKLDINKLKPNQVMVEWLARQDPWYGSIVTSLTFINTETGIRNSYGTFPYNKAQKGVQSEAVDISEWTSLGLKGHVGQRGISFSIIGLQCPGRL